MVPLSSFPKTPLILRFIPLKKKTRMLLYRATPFSGASYKNPNELNTAIKDEKKGVAPSPHPSDQNPLIRVLKVVDRARDSYIGTFKKNHYNETIIIADDPYVIPEFIVSDPSLKESKLKPKEGDKVVFELLNWSQRALMPEAKIIRILGQTHEPMAEFKTILHKYHLNPNFPKDAQSEADNLPQKVGKKDTKYRLDFRNTYTFTIDPDDAKDFDDALSIRTLDDQSIEIGIHIADVSAYVKPKSALDIEAQERGNSTYLVGTVIPMLPHSLSNGLCSLSRG